MGPLQDSHWSCPRARDRLASFAPFVLAAFALALAIVAARAPLTIPFLCLRCPAVLHVTCLSTTVTRTRLGSTTVLACPLRSPVF